MDDKSKTGKADDIRINIAQDHEVDYWSGQLGISRQELLDAVTAAGPMVEDLKEYLNQRSSGRKT